MIGDEAAPQGQRRRLRARRSNIMRTPLGGRTFEAYGEDPYLVSQHGRRLDRGRAGAGRDRRRQALRGQQPGGLLAAGERRRARPAARAAADRGQPHDSSTRRSTSARCARSTCRTSRPRSSEAHVGTVMCSYNRVNGTYACENEHLLHEILEKEWGFKGYRARRLRRRARHGRRRCATGSTSSRGRASRYGAAAGHAALTTGQATAGAGRRARAPLSCARCSPSAFFDRAAYADDDAQIDKAGARRRPRRASRSRAITLLREPAARRCR